MGTFGKATSSADAWDKQFTLTFTLKHLPMDRDYGSSKKGIPHGRDVGDGISLFEEYRGFHVKGFHRRLNPLEKDVLIYSELSSSDGIMFTFVDDGDIGHAGNLPEINLHEINIDEAG